MNSDNDYESMALDPLMVLHAELENRISAVLKESGANPDDLSEFREMERELTRRET